MNRSIKFRAWNGKEMFYPFAPRNLRIGKTSWSLWEYDTIIATSDDSDNVLMQYTNSQDKEGVDIYEGDIVQYYDSYYEKYFTAMVIWDNALSCYLPCGLHTAKIIGNKYENPKLVKDRMGD